jgi:hypothetical protein
VRDPTQVESKNTCPYFRRPESKLYRELVTNDPGSAGYCYCHGYGMGYFRVATVHELREFCLGDLHVRCPVYDWLRENGRLGLVRKQSG